MKTEHSKNKNQYLWLVVSLVIFIGCFIFSIFYDLSINQTIYSPTNTFAILMEAFGWYPSFLILVYYCALWFTNKKQDQKIWQTTLAYICFFVTLGIMCWDSLRRLKQRNWIAGFTDLRCLPWIFMVLLCGIVIWFCAYKTPIVLKNKLRFWAFGGTVYLAANQAVIFIFKTIWNRTRFDDMVTIGNFELFTPWYSPFANGGNSFPSGHTANAAGVFILIILCDLFPSWNKKRKLVYVFIWSYIALMAFSRILIGRHFLSDTLAAAAIMAILFYILRRTSFYKKGLQKVQKQIH